MKRIGTVTLISAGGAATYGAALVAMDVLVAHRYGLGDQAAVFQAAYQVPATLIAVLSGGAILGPLIPVVGRTIQQSGPAHASDFLARVAGFSLGAQGLVVIALFVLAPQVVLAIASGFPAQTQDEVVTVLRWMLPLLVLNGLASIGISTLLASQRYLLANLAPALMPIAGMATWAFWDEHGARWMAWGYLAGTALQVLLLSAQLRRDRLEYLPPAWPRGEAVGIFMRTFAATALAHAVLATVLLVNTSVAGSISERDLTAFGYGSKLVLLALAFLTTLINNVGLPYLSELEQRGSVEAFWRRLRYIIRLTAVAGTVLALAWVFCAGWIVNLLYARGNFGTADVMAVVGVQRVFVLQAPFYLIGVVCWRTLNIAGEWRPLVIASFVALLVDVAAAAVLLQRFGTPGIAAAHVLSMVAWSATLLLAMQLRSRNELKGLQS